MPTDLLIALLFFSVYLCAGLICKVRIQSRDRDLTERIERRVHTILNSPAAVQVRNTD